MYHFRSRVSLLLVIRQRDGVKLPLAIISSEYDGWIFPRDGRTGFNLCPRNFRVITFTQAAFRDKVIDTSFSVFVASVPVLNGGVLYFGVFPRVNLYNRSVKLVFVVCWSSATFEIRNV